MENAMALLRSRGVQPTPQRTAVAEFVLKGNSHPTADEVFVGARRICPTVSRATVYNTLNLLVAKGVLKSQILKEGTVVFEPNSKKHHHFIDDQTGAIHDIPWDSLVVTGEENLNGFEVREFQVVLRGRRKKV
jgi:Fe2+ or Zn2+ uptake regulation protein